MKILHVINYAGGGGTEKYVLTLIRRQIAAGHTCILAYHVDGQLVGDAEMAGAKTFCVPMRHILDFRAARTLTQICREHGVEVIHGLFEEALHLLRVQIHGHKAVGAGQLHALGAHARADRDARFVLFVAFRISEIRYNRSNGICACPFKSIHPKQQFY